MNIPDEFELLKYYAKYYPRSASQPCISAGHKPLCENGCLIYKGRSDMDNFVITPKGLERLAELKRQNMKRPTAFQLHLLKHLPQDGGYCSGDKIRRPSGYSATTSELRRLIEKGYIELHPDQRYTFRLTEIVIQWLKESES